MRRLNIINYKLVSKKVSKNLTLSRAYLHFLRENNCHCLLDCHGLVAWWQVIKMLQPQCSNDRSVKRFDVFVTKNSITLNCVNASKVFRNIIHCNSIFDVWKAYFTDVNLPPTPSDVPIWLRTRFRYFIIKLRIEESVKHFILFLNKHVILCDANFNVYYFVCVTF